MRKRLSVIFVCALLMVVLFSGCSETTNNKEKTQEYFLNNWSFSVLDDWILNEEKTEDNEISFVKNSEDVDKDVKDTLIIRYEKIPEIMKLDTGDGGIKTKDDVVKKYSYGSISLVNMTFSEWKHSNGFEYCEQYFETEGKLADGSYGNRYGREIIVPINTTEAYLHAVTIGDEEIDMQSLNAVIETLHQSE